jgi:transposase-like protein
MSVQNRRKYDSDFKRNAVLLTEEPGRTVREVADNLGINSDLIYRWRRQQSDNGELAFPGHGKMALTPDQKRIRELEKKLKDTEMERDILKKAMAIFSRTSK